MMIGSSAPRSLLLAGAVMGVFTFGAAAQQPATPRLYAYINGGAPD